MRDHLWLILALVGSAGLAVVARRSPEAKEGPVPVASTVQPATPAASGSDEAGTTIAGRVVERIDVPNYTYLLLAVGQAAAQTWVAVSTSNVRVGENVRVVDAQLMTNFASATLKRTFDAIYFGVLDQGAANPGAANPGAANPGANAEVAHWVQRGADPHAGVPGAPALGPGHGPGASANPHGTTSDSGKNVVVGSVAKAEGSFGRTVAETFSQRRTLAGQTVRVRAVVVKVVSGVLDRNFVRVRDGSENAEVRDLLVTTQAMPAIGDRVLFEGKVAIDKDFGAGYSYPVLLEDAVSLGDAGPAGTRP